MEYTYNILIEVYYWMLSGKKTIEVRLLKEKSNNIQINDYITFKNQEVEGKYIKTKIIGKFIYDSIKELIKNNNINQIMPNHS